MRPRPTGTRIILYVAGACVAWLSAAGRSFAENVCFLRGDAFFHGTLNSDSTFEARQSGVLRIRYVSPAAGSFSGWAGYAQMEVHELGAFADNLQTAYTWARLDDPKQMAVIHDVSREVDQVTINADLAAVETNPLGLFVYNRDVSINDIKIGVKYNESWKEETRQFMRRPENSPILDEFVRSYDCVIESWARAEDVACLKVRLPSTEIVKGKNVTTPVVCNASDLLAIVTSFRSYENVYSAANDTTIYVVTSHRVECYSGNDGKWEAQDIKRLVDKRPGGMRPVPAGPIDHPSP